jgi:DNA-binding NarL/FixJ family response regulator
LVANRNPAGNSGSGHSLAKPETEKVRVLVADDHSIILRGLCKVLNSSESCEVVEVATTGQEAISKARESKPDVAVLDVSMPILNGIETTFKIRAEFPQIEVLILTAYESEQLAIATLEAGARGYLLKSDAAWDLVLAVKSVARGRPFFSTPLAQEVLNGYLHARKQRFGSEFGHGLTPCERQIIQLLAEGYSNKEIASRRGIAVRTAKTHHANIMRKLRLRSISDLVHFAVRNQIILA